MSDNTNVDFNVDTFEQERANDPAKKENYSFVLAGRRIELSDPNKVDWKTLAEMTAPVELLKHVTLSEDDRQWLRDHPMSIEALKSMMDRYSRHFGLPEMGKGAGSVI